MQDYTKLIAELSKSLCELKKSMPEVCEGFYDMHDAANKEGVLSFKTKELIAIAIAVADRCDPCIGFHVKALINAGGTRQELLETLSVATYMGGGPSLMYAAKTLQAFDEFNNKSAM